MENQVKVDVGLSAKAEIKAEVPSGAMGRLVDALTDAIRPFTELRGFKGDLIRLQREDVLIEITKRARERLALENAPPQPISHRVLIPLLEKASWTDPEDDLLVNAWANLLAEASCRPHPNQAIAIDILSKLDPLHVRLLNENINKKHGFGIEDVPIDYDEYSIRESVAKLIKKYIEKNDPNKIDELESDIDDLMDVKGVFYDAGAIDIDGIGYFEFEPENFSVSSMSLKEALSSLNILRENYVRDIKVGGCNAWLLYYNLTAFGVEFVQACTSLDKEESA